MRTIVETTELVAVDKPPGLAVVPAGGESASACLQNRLAEERGEGLWVVHRLDRETSGVVVFARTPEAHRSLSRAFEERRVEKVYVAYAAGDLVDVLRIDTPLHAARKGKSRPAEPGEHGAKDAVTDVVVERRWRYGDDVVSRVRCRPATGRHHQIRVHLRSVEAPVVHDPLYGRATLRGPLGDAPCERAALHAASLALPDHPTIAAPLPEDMLELEAWLDEHWEPR